jgi:(R)-amidase
MPTLNVLLGQLPVVAGSIDANTDALIGALAANPTADLALFPEMFLPGYDTLGLGARTMMPDSAPLARIAEAAAAHQTAVIVGFAEQAPEGIYNSAGCIDERGEWAGTYRKTHLFGEGETGAFLPGHEYVIVELAGTRVGVQICFDTEFPEPARAMALGGAELIATISANMVPYDLEHRLGAAARAIENRLPHAYCNRVGEQAGFSFLGESAAIDAGGRDLVLLGPAPDSAVCAIPIGADTVGEVDYLRLLPGELPVRDFTRTGPLG